MNHLSGLDAWRIKLFAQANRKKTNSTIQADIQYFVTKCLIIIVRQMPDVVHSRASKIKGGSMKINWKRFNTITTADNAGYFKTNSPCISLMSMSRVCKFRFRLTRKM